VVRSIALLAAAIIALAGVSGAAARPAAHQQQQKAGMLVGIYDEAQALYGNPDRTFPILKDLRVQVLRSNLYWGGEFGVAKARPANAGDPSDPAYDWAIYDRLVQYANASGIKVVFSIWGTPKWANGGRALNRVPARADDLQKFANAAAKRYNGRTEGDDGRLLPRVQHWIAWNEPNNPNFIFPQYRKVGSGYQVESARQYAKICNAVYAGVKSALATDKVACGVTGPRGNNNPKGSRASVSPLAFLRAAKAAGMKRFDAYAHHPYYGQASEEPGKAPPSSRKGTPSTAVTLGNFSNLVKEVTRLYGAKRIWITEYGYQTNPPDRQFGVTPAKQAAYLKQAYAIARKNPRVDMMLWFLLRDEPIIEGWQSGLLTARGLKKPAYNAFRALPR
jgi:hypothetical protein